ncbi:helix-hairpin-helix domain-containing protein [Lactococcus garvieae]|uniref:Late competence protein ComEA, DNA receptor n=1 Tax=Lactococcus garvieae DCC43 TaxID=1231377 RepID=K2PWP6_9LACT|nr:helix-hairpin-helix domain-containing protein [Lactococcus garvieae]EKF51876.1 Late competence protein ComEA, DNA receptor [Lactococcus garvieae DCC43]
MDKITEYIRKNQKVIVGIALSLAALGIFYLSRQEKKDNQGNFEAIEWSASDKKKTNNNSQEEKATEDTIFVDVKGAVKKPGIYKLSSKHRVSDAIVHAGGFADNAERKAINLAKKLQDEAEVYVPIQGEADTSKLLESNSHGGEQQEKAKVNINTADLTELQQLSGIGAKRAQDIIDYRTEKGNFQSVDDLIKVSGFGAKTLEKLKEAITVDE